MVSREYYMRSNVFEGDMLNEWNCRNSKSPRNQIPGDGFAIPVKQHFILQFQLLCRYRMRI